MLCHHCCPFPHAGRQQVLHTGTVNTVRYEFGLRLNNAWIYYEMSLITSSIVVTIRVEPSVEVFLVFIFEIGQQSMLQPIHFFKYLFEIFPEMYGVVALIVYRFPNKHNKKNTPSRRLNSYCGDYT